MESKRRRIAELPDTLVSQIAAGEVVERPASVVRELLDNALDAGATQIVVRLQGGGVRAISVEDDGAGIEAAELPLALKRHATSKIASLADLESVTTMGFRGEALAAIASVAEVSVSSRTTSAPHASCLQSASGEVSAAARAVGTTVEVRELFFSTPARRKFLKTDATEYAHVLEARAPPCTGAARCRLRGLARRAAGRAVPARYSGPTLARRAGPRLHRREPGTAVAARPTGAGWPGSASRKPRVPGPICSTFSSTAATCATGCWRMPCGRPYEDQLHGSRQPAYALFITIEPELVDVNVHPAKIEVRFRDGRAVHSGLRLAVAEAWRRRGRVATDANASTRSGAHRAACHDRVAACTDLARTCAGS